MQVWIFFIYFVWFIHPQISMIDCIYNDGGRRQALRDTHDVIRYGMEARDCVTRALAIMTERPYTEIWAALADVNKSEGRRHSANFGVFVGRRAYIDYSESLGLTYVPLDNHPMLKDAPLPGGRIVLNVYRHSVAMIDGVLHDTHHPSPAGKMRVKGYWITKPAPAAMFNVCNPTTGAALNRAPLNHSQAETMARLLLLNYKTQTLIKSI